MGQMEAFSSHVSGVIRPTSRCSPLSPHFHPLDRFHAHQKRREREREVVKYNGTAEKQLILMTFATSRAESNIPRRLCRGGRAEKFIRPTGVERCRSTFVSVAFRARGLAIVRGTMRGPAIMCRFVSDRFLRSYIFHVELRVSPRRAIKSFRDCQAVRSALGYIFFLGFAPHRRT